MNRKLDVKIKGEINWKIKSETKCKLNAKLNIAN